MRVLVGCEESQTVCLAFRRKGHEAYSCDIQPTRGRSDLHIQGDVKEAIKSKPKGYYDLIILHPDCTAMAVSGNRWYGKDMPRHQERIDSIKWTMDLWELAKEYSDRVILENPVSVIFTELKKKEVIQYIQPWMFGHGETKKTGLALHNVDPLKATNVVEGREQKVWKMWGSKNRKRDRSETYQGVADALADQLGG